MVNDVRVVLRDDGTNRRARLALEYSAGDGPPTVFAKAVDPEHADLVELTSGLYHEPRLFSAKVPLPLDHPAVYAAVIDEDRRNFLMVMEDIVARGADPRDATRPMTVEQVASGVRGLAGLHSRYWGHRLTSRTELNWVEPFVAFAGLEYAPLHIAHERLGDSVPTEILELSGTDLFSDIWARYIGSLTEPGPAPTLLHGDPHIGNTYVLPDGTVGFLDWQMVRRGNYSLARRIPGCAAPSGSGTSRRAGHLAALPGLGGARPRDLDGHALGRRRMATRRHLPHLRTALRRGIRRPRHPSGNRVRLRLTHSANRRRS